jgi:hypothetical protein
MKPYGEIVTTLDNIGTFLPRGEIAAIFDKEMILSTWQDSWHIG